MAKRGTKITDYHAKIFGGSNMLANTTIKEDDRVGNRNSMAAIKYVTEKEIPLLVAHVGETGHRCIAFDVQTGDVWVKHHSLQKIIP